MICYKNNKKYVKLYKRGSNNFNFYYTQYHTILYFVF